MVQLCWIIFFYSTKSEPGHLTGLRTSCAVGEKTEEGDTSRKINIVYVNQRYVCIACLVNSQFYHFSPESHILHWRLLFIDREPSTFSVLKYFKSCFSCTSSFHWSWRPLSVLGNGLIELLPVCRDFYQIRESFPILRLEAEGSFKQGNRSICEGNLWWQDVYNFVALHLDNEPLLCNSPTSMEQPARRGVGLQQHFQDQPQKSAKSFSALHLLIFYLMVLKTGLHMTSTPLWCATSVVLYWASCVFLFCVILKSPSSPCCLLLCCVSLFWSTEELWCKLVQLQSGTVHQKQW